MSLINRNNLVGYWPLDGYALDRSAQELELGRTYFISDANLVNYLKLNGNSTDSKGSNNGTDTNITYTSGHFGQYATFNGSSSKIVLPTNESNSAMSAVLWVNVSVAVDTRVYYGRSSSSANPIFGIQLANGVPTFRIRNDSSSLVDATATGKDLRDSQWHMIGITYAGASGAMLIYVDGVQAGSATGPSGSVSINQTGLGYDYRDGNWFTGSIDDFSRFSDVLTAQEMKDIYLAGRSANHGTVTGALPVPSQNPAIPASLAYKFNGSSDYIALPSYTNFSFTNFSILAIVKPTNTTHNGHIIDGWNFVGNAGWQIQVDNGGNLYFQAYINGATRTITTTSSARTMYLAMTWDGTTFRGYVNGKQVGTPLTPGGSLVAPNDYMTIGAYRYTNSGEQKTNYFNGTIQEVAFFNKSFTFKEYLQIYNQSKWKYGAKNVLGAFFQAFSMIASAGTATATQYSTFLKYARIFIASGKSVIATGYSSTLVRGLGILAEAGTVIANGYTANLKAFRILIASLGSATATGYTATITYIRKIIASLGTAIALGYSAILRTTAWAKDPKPTNTWTKDSKPSNDWTNDTKF